LMHAFAGDCAPESELSVNGAMATPDRPGGPALINIKKFQVPAKFGERTVLRAQKFGCQGLAIPAAELVLERRMYSASAQKVKTGRRLTHTKGGTDASGNSNPKLF
jgi:hypothetical protein